MPWPETDAMRERLECVVRARQPGANVSALCRAYGVSRKTGYKWLRRSATAGTLAGGSGCPARTKAGGLASVCWAKASAGAGEIGVER